MTSRTSYEKRKTSVDGCNQYRIRYQCEQGNARSVIVHTNKSMHQFLSGFAQYALDNLPPSARLLSVTTVQPTNIVEI